MCVESWFWLNPCKVSQIVCIHYKYKQKKNNAHTERDTLKHTFCVRQILFSPLSRKLLTKWHVWTKVSSQNSFALASLLFNWNVVRPCVRTERKPYRFCFTFWQSLWISKKLNKNFTINTHHRNVNFYLSGGLHSFISIVGKQISCHSDNKH